MLNRSRPLSMGSGMPNLLARLGLVLVLMFVSGVPAWAHDPAASDDETDAERKPPAILGCWTVEHVANDDFPGREWLEDVEPPLHVRADGYVTTGEADDLTFLRWEVRGDATDFTVELLRRTRGPAELRQGRSERSRPASWMVVEEDEHVFLVERATGRVQATLRHMACPVDLSAPPAETLFRTWTVDDLERTSNVPGLAVLDAWDRVEFRRLVLLDTFGVSYPGLVVLGKGEDRRFISVYINKWRGVQVESQADALPFNWQLALSGDRLLVLDPTTGKVAATLTPTGD